MIWESRPVRGTRHLGAALAVSGAVAVLTLGIAAAPLYLSSVGSAASQVQFDERCPTQIGLSIQSGTAAQSRVVLDFMAKALRDLKPIEPAQATTTFGVVTVESPDGIARRALVLARSDTRESLHLVEGGFGPGAYVPVSVAATFGVHVGGTITFAGNEGLQFTVAVAAIYTDFTPRTLPQRWCALSASFQPTRGGDPPIPTVVVDEAVLRTLPLNVQNASFVTTELVVRRRGLTLTALRRLAARVPAITSAYDGYFEAVGIDRFRHGPLGTELPFIVKRSDAIVALVRANLTPVRLAAGAAGVVIVLAAAALSARRRHHDLYLLATRGAGPLRLAAACLARDLPAAALGTAIGWSASFGVVLVGGPSGDFERAALRSSLAWAAVAFGAAAVLLFASTALCARRLVGRSARPLQSRGWRLVPWEIAVIVPVVLAARRLDQVGGVQLIGSQTTNADQWALAFPVLAAVGIAVLAVRPVALAAGGLRAAGRRSPPGLLVALRRIAADRASTAIVFASVTLAVTSAALASTLATSGTQSLRDKAATFLGAESSSTLLAEPKSLPPNATVVRRSSLRDGSVDVDLLAIDATTIDHGGYWRGSGRASDLLRALPPPDAKGVVSAYVIGPLPTGVLKHFAGDSLTVRVHARLAWFPSVRRSTTLVVVRMSDVPPTFTRALELWVRGDPQSTISAIEAQGFAVPSSLTVTDVIGTTSFRAVQWAFTILRVLALVIAVVLIAVELMVADARARVRQVTDVLARRRGWTPGRALRSAVIELGLPTIVALGVGLAAARFIAGCSVPRRDTDRGLAPAASVIVSGPALAAIVGFAALSVVLVAAAATVMARRARPTEVLRVA